MQKESLGQLALQPGEHFGCDSDVRIRQQHHKFLAPIARQLVAGAQVFLDDAHDVLQRFIAGLVAEAVVECLEIVYVEKRHAHR